MVDVLSTVRLFAMYHPFAKKENFMRYKPGDEDPFRCSFCGHEMLKTLTRCNMGCKPK